MPFGFVGVLEPQQGHYYLSLLLFNYSIIVCCCQLLGDNIAETLSAGVNHFETPKLTVLNDDIGAVKEIVHTNDTGVFEITLQLAKTVNVSDAFNVELLSPGNEGLVQLTLVARCDDCDAAVQCQLPFATTTIKPKTLPTTTTTTTTTTLAATTTTTVDSNTDTNTIEPTTTKVQTMTRVITDTIVATETNADGSTVFKTDENGATVIETVLKTNDNGETLIETVLVTDTLGNTVLQTLQPVDTSTIDVGNVIY